MNGRLHHLLEEARQEPHLGRPNWTQYASIVRTLREKTWSYRRIFDWLVARGEPLDPAMFSRFRVAISTRANRQRKLSEKPGTVTDTPPATASGHPTDGKEATP